VANPSGKKLHEQAISLFKQDKYEAALQKLNEALPLVEGQPRPTAEIYNDMGVIYKQLKDYPAAHQALDKAMTLFTEISDQKGQAQTLGNRAAIYEAEGQPEKAVDTYKQAAAMLEKLGESEMAMYVWQAISRLRTKQGQYIAAIGAYEEGIENMPEGSFKRKIMQQLMKLPGSMMGNLGSGTDPSDK
jgi:tetratricopeptide (TPR) repeat protein